MTRFKSRKRQLLPSRQGRVSWMLSDPWVPLKDHPLLRLLRLIFEGSFIIGLLVRFRLCLPRVLPGVEGGDRLQKKSSREEADYESLWSWASVLPALRVELLELRCRCQLSSLRHYSCHFSFRNAQIPS